MRQRGRHGVPAGRRAGGIGTMMGPPYGAALSSGRGADVDTDAAEAYRGGGAGAQLTAATGTAKRYVGSLPKIRDDRGVSCPVVVTMPISSRYPARAA